VGVGRMALLEGTAQKSKYAEWCMQGIPAMVPRTHVNLI
jgi:hypothetical protein